mgnify:CR=1 FL=1
MGGRLDTPYYGSDQLQENLASIAARAQAFVRSVPVTADEIEINVQLEDQWGFYFEAGRSMPLANNPKKVTRARIFRDRHMGQAIVAGDTKEAWFQALELAENQLRPFDEEKPAAPTSAFPVPLTFDPQLSDFACDGALLAELSEALLDNCLHEIERVKETTSPEGGVKYGVSGAVLARSRGVQTALTGHLEALIRFDHAFSERVIQVHCPESFLPLALMGARAYRNRPTEVGDPRTLPLGSPMPIVIHPRVLETLLRKAGSRLFQPGVVQFMPSGVKVASENLTLIDDPHLDGLRFSRSFDDAGLATRRLPLMVNGRITQRFSSGAPLNPLRGEAGNRWYRVGEGRSLSAGFSSILVERGTSGFHELIGARPQHVLVNNLSQIEVDEDPAGHFCARVSGAVLINGEGPNKILPPNCLQIEGRLFGAPGGGAGLLSDVQVSRELHDTGSAILPYLVTTWPIGLVE